MPVIPPGYDRDMRADVLPPAILPLFDDPFVQSCDLLEEYIGRLAVHILDRLGLQEAASTPGTALELVERLELDTTIAPGPLSWLLELAADRVPSLIRHEQSPSDPTQVAYSLTSPLPELDPGEIFKAQEAHDASALPSYEIAAFAAEAYPECLRGEISGERALFAPQRLAHWSRYFNNDNPLYGINNRIPALAAADGGPYRSILELGGGLGSGGEALLGELASAGKLDAVEEYFFTDISPVFLRRGQRALAAVAPDLTLQAGRLDIDKKLGDQGVDYGTYDLVFAVNTVHVARDLAATLAEIRKALKPGGRLILGEGIRPFAGQAIYSELVFLLLESFRSPLLHPGYRPTGGFLTPENWRQALSEAGFEEIELLPDIARVREHYPSFLVASLSARAT